VEISDEIVEVAAKAMFNSECRSVAWEDLGEWKSDWLKLARISIQAAIPMVVEGLVPGLIEALQAVEFGNDGLCRMCSGWMVSENGCTKNAHTKDCDIAKAIAKATGNEK